jgi:4-amino-4-deoxy-L-arabinose transferase-like glycosyltransferase
MNNFLTILKKKIIENKFLILLSLFYFILRIINLTRLPIFNDEAIYLDWGYREIHVPGFLYYSLYDAKQPLLMWIFGIFANIFGNPLFGGRLVSVIAGFFTFLGIYKLSKYLFSRQVGLISIFVYSVTPIFSFFDRQALMESSIAAVGVWSCYFFLKNLNSNKKNTSIIIGIILGLGFFIKSTTLIFLFSYLSLSILLIIFSKNKLKKTENIVYFLISFSLTIILLLLNPLFWKTFQTNSRYSLTITEVLAFPLGEWISNLFANLTISFFYITPFVFLISIAGVVKIFLEKKFTKNLFLFFFIIPLVINTILTRVPSDRYLVSFLPFLVIIFSYLSFEVINKNKIYLVLFIFIILIPFSLTIFQIANPAKYILSMSNITSFNDLLYIKGQNSGYGINETISYLDNLSLNQKIIIGTGENTGNPESSIFVFFNSNKNTIVTYFDGRLIGQDLNNYDCIISDLPIYFVARDEQLVGLDKLLQKEKTISKPFDKSTIGIYKLIAPCKGRALKMQLKRNNTI